MDSFLGARSAGGDSGSITLSSIMTPTGASAAFAAVKVSMANTDAEEVLTDLVSARREARKMVAATPAHRTPEESLQAALQRYGTGAASAAPQKVR